MLTPEEARQQIRELRLAVDAMAAEIEQQEAQHRAAGHLHCPSCDRWMTPIGPGRHTCEVCAMDWTDGPTVRAERREAVRVRARALGLTVLDGGVLRPRPRERHLPHRPAARGAPPGDAEDEPSPTTPGGPRAA